MANDFTIAPTFSISWTKLGMFVLFWIHSESKECQWNMIKCFKNGPGIWSQSGYYNGISFVFFKYHKNIYVGLRQINKLLTFKISIYLCRCNYRKRHIITDLFWTPCLFFRNGCGFQAFKCQKDQLWRMLMSWNARYEYHFW